jgi:hypothetical protein
MRGRLRKAFPREEVSETDEAVIEGRELPDRFAAAHESNLPSAADGHGGR